MKQMKKLFFVTTFLMVMVVAPMAMADQVQIGYEGSNYGMYQTGSGGEFSVKPIGFEGVLGLYDSKVKGVGPGTFQTFCIEVLETINPFPTTYNSVFNSKAIYGGQGPAGDPISVGTAYLYDLFRKGTSTVAFPYDYTNPGRSGTGNSADLLQKTFWWLEDEPGYGDPTDSNPFRALAYSMFGDPKEDNNGRYNVAVLNLTDNNGGRHQDLLVAVPEPATMLFLGGGLLGMAGFLRKKFKKK